MLRYLENVRSRNRTKQMIFNVIVRTRQHDMFPPCLSLFTLHFFVPRTRSASVLYLSWSNTKPSNTVVNFIIDFTFTK